MFATTSDDGILKKIKEIEKVFRDLVFDKEENYPRKKEER